MPLRRKINVICLIALFSLSACQAGSGQQAERVTKYTLGNGMTVIIQPIHSSPVVAEQVWVHVGSKDEDDVTRGLAHIQEHMLFKGTKKYKVGEIDKTVKAAGGVINAFTAVLEDRARATAKTASGPLKGIPFAVKNLFDVKGLPTLAGSKINRDLPPATCSGLCGLRVGP